MTVNRTGFYQTNYTLEIDKDAQAQLVYTFDWSDWLLDGVTLTSAEYEVKARINDPTPVVIVDEGNTATESYVELSSGQANKSYIVTVKVTTSNAQVDRRSFKLNVVNRSA